MSLVPVTITSAGAAPRSAWSHPALVALACAAALLLAPWIWSDGASLSLLSQMATLMLFGLSYNLLLGQGGMLSLGHAMYSGLGAFAAIHVLQAMDAGSVHWPLTLLPLAGGAAGLLCGALFGYLTTRTGGTTFAMITLGLGELVAAGASMFPALFGGESGVAADRVVGDAGWFGITYGPQIEVYYLIVAWLLLCGTAMYGFTRTPLGRLLNAVRDNPERAEFIGCDPRRVRWLTLMAAAFFAGVAGALSAINFEIVSVENLGALRSGAVLMATVIGGSAWFFGPVLGAALSVFFSILLAAHTAAWQLYMGAFFMLTVMFAPGGMAGAAAALGQLRRAACWQAARYWLAGAALASLCGIAAAVAVTEALYRWRFGPGSEEAAATLPLGVLAIGLASLLLSLLALAWLRRGLLRAMVQPDHAEGAP